VKLAALLYCSFFAHLNYQLHLFVIIMGMYLLQFSGDGFHYVG